MRGFQTSETKFYTFSFLKYFLLARKVFLPKKPSLRINYIHSLWFPIHKVNRQVRRLATGLKWHRDNSGVWIMWKIMANFINCLFPPRHKIVYSSDFFPPCSCIILFRYFCSCFCLHELLCH